MTIRTAKIITWAMAGLALLVVIGSGVYYASNDLPREVKRERARPYTMGTGMLVGAVLIPVWSSALASRKQERKSTKSLNRKTAETFD